MKRLVSLLLVLALLCALPLLGQAKERGREALHKVNLDHSNRDSFTNDNYFKARWITVSATIHGPAEIRVIVTQKSNGKDVYDHTEKGVDGVFTSDEIYLEYVKSETIPYRVELYVNGEKTKDVIIHRMLLMLPNNNVTTRGIRFREYESSLTDKWFMFTPIDFDAIDPNNGTQVLDLIGSNMYFVGKLTIQRNGDAFMLSMVNIDDYNNSHDASQRILDEEYPSDAPVIDDHQFKFSEMNLALFDSMSKVHKKVEHKKTPAEYKLDTWYSIADDLGGATKQILYLNGRISYDPNGLKRFEENIKSDDNQQLMDLLNSFPN